MKTNNFRLGNWIIDYEAEPEVTIYYQVEQIKEYYDGSGIGLVYRNGSCWTSEPNAIPLTEEILLKCGFSIVDGWDDQIYWRRKDFSFNSFELMQTHKGFLSPNDQEIKYLHILQNCFYFHEFKELEIDLNN